MTELLTYYTVSFKFQLSYLSFTHLYLPYSFLRETICAKLHCYNICCPQPCLKPHDLIIHFPGENYTSLLMDIRLGHATWFSQWTLILKCHALSEQKLSESSCGMWVFSYFPLPWDWWVSETAYFLVLFLKMEAIENRTAFNYKGHEKWLKNKLSLLKDTEIWRSLIFVTMG